MAQSDLNVMLDDLFWPMIGEGFGVGLLWPSITAITFSTLNHKYLDEGTAFYHLTVSYTHLTLPTILLV